jgi:excisionase family DNA binding protein
MSRMLLTLGEAAERLGCSTTTVRRRIREGALPVFRDGRLLRVRDGDLERYIAANVTRGTLGRAGVRAAGVVLPAHARLWDTQDVQVSRGLTGLSHCVTIDR